MLRFCHLLNTIPPDQHWQQVALLEGVKDPPTPAAKTTRLAGKSSGDSAQFCDDGMVQN